MATQKETVSTILDVSKVDAIIMKTSRILVPII